MIIESVKVAGLGPIRKPYRATFVRENCIVGYNGCGKTFLFRAIAGVCGTDEATMLVDGMEVEHFYLRARQGRTTYVYETRDRFDADEIARFKSTLPERVSFPLTEWDVNFPSRGVDPQEGRDNFQRYARNHSGRINPIMTRYSPVHRSADVFMGDGFTQAFWLLLNDTPRGVPLLLDNPGRHLDMMAKRTMIDLLTNNDRQLLFTTHDPEMVLHDGWKGTNKQQKVIEVSDKKIRTKQKSS